jgi:hypothetical protein
MPRTVRTCSLLLIVIYAALWLLTATVGSREIRLLVKTRLEEHSGTALREIPDRLMRHSAYPYFYARSMSPCPFVLRVHYTFGSGQLAEEGWVAWYAWMFGWSHRMVERQEWVS